MGINIGGVDVDIGIGSPASFLIIFLIAVAVSAIGLSVHMNVSKRHPKVKFKMFAKNGTFNKEVRLYAGTTACTLDAWSILLGKVPSGFDIKYFTYDFDGARATKYYNAFWIDGRIIPTNLNLGSTTFTLYKCSNPQCGLSDENIKSYDKNEHGVAGCPKCKANMTAETVLIDNIKLHALKFHPELERRYIVMLEGLGEEIHQIPLKEWIRKYDIGAQITDIMTHSVRETDSYIERLNPIMTVIYQVLPFGAVVIAAVLVAYIFNMSMTQNQNEASRMLYETAKLLAASRGMNVTNITG